MLNASSQPSSIRQPNPTESNRIHPRSQDGNFSEEAFRETLNAELANTVGNMLNRTLGLLHKYCDGRMPVGAGEAAGADHPLRVAVAEGVDKVGGGLDR